MAGLLIVLMGLASVMIPLVLFLGYLLDSGFISSVLHRGGQKRLRGWIPCYGQLLLGQIAGMPRLGMALMLNHLASAVVVMLGFLLPKLEVYDILFQLLFCSAAIGFVLKEWITHGIFAKAAGKWSIPMTILDVMTLGFSRSVLLYVMRKRVTLPSGEGQM